MSLVLASTSPYRRALLERLELPFEQASPGVSEDALAGESPAALARRLAAEKARAVAPLRPASTVIGSDQVAELDGRILGKPGGFEAAREQLRASSGRQVRFHTGLCVIAADGREAGHVEPVTVGFRKLRAEEIDTYLQLDKPWDCAGSFRWERLGISLFEYIEARDPTALEGLPLIALCALLRPLGFDPLGAPAGRG